MSFFGGGKKRDLSDGSKSKDVDDSKKVKEQYDTINSMPDDVFIDGLSSPTCAKMLLNCLKTIETRVADLYSLFDVLKDNQVKGERQLDSVNESISSLSTKFDKLEEERIKQNDKINELEDNIGKLVDENKILKESIDELEQYSRRNCLLFHGLKESDGENTDKVVIDTIRKEMTIDISEQDLDRTHRIGKASRNDGKSRPIIVKFARYAVRNQIYKNKRVLKGKNLLITESLTNRRVKALKDAQAEFGTSNVWTSDGRIFYKNENRVHKL